MLRFNFDLSSGSGNKIRSAKCPGIFYGNRLQNVIHLRQFYQCFPKQQASSV